MHHGAHLCPRHLLEKKNQREVFVNILCCSLGSENFEIGRCRDPANTFLLFLLQARLPLEPAGVHKTLWCRGRKHRTARPQSPLTLLRFAAPVSSALSRRQMLRLARGAPWTGGYVGGAKPGAPGKVSAVCEHPEQPLQEAPRPLGIH